METNTRIEYQYRDGDNYKFGEEVIVAGTATEKQVKAILYQEKTFVCHQVDPDWPDPHDQAKAFDFPSDGDHVFCEIVSVEEVYSDPTVEMNMTELLGRINKEEGEWDIVEAMMELGL